MKSFTYLYVLILFFLISCGKSPLLNKKSNEVFGHYGLEEQKVFHSADIKLALSWVTNINTTDACVAVLLVSRNGKLIDFPEDYYIYLWMPIMGHGSSPVTISHLATGVYKISDIYFIMDGYWQMRFQLKTGATVLEELFYEYNL